MKYKLGLYIPEDGILHSHCRGNFKSYRYKEHKSEEGSKGESKWRKKRMKDEGYKARREVR
jgi:hypothetical protein